MFANCTNVFYKTKVQVVKRYLFNWHKILPVFSENILSENTGRLKKVVFSFKKDFTPIVHGQGAAIACILDM
jgi:hypothetical protein